MTKDEFTAAIALVRRHDERSLYESLDGAYRQIRLLNEEFDVGKRRLARVAGNANRSIATLRERRRANTEEKIPFEQQEFRLASAYGGEGVQALIVKRLRDLEAENVRTERKMTHRLRQVRIEARALAQYGDRIRLVEEAYELISIAASLRSDILALGYDPDALSETELQRIESILTKG